MSRWLSIVGIGEDGLAGLGAVARALVDDATVLIGGDRHLAMLPDDGRERLTWPSPLAKLVDEIVARRGQAVCVLATGNPQFYGVGVTLGRRVPAEEMTIIPAPSAFALAAARLGWAQAETEMLTLHGRPLESLVPSLQPGARLLLLSHDRATPAAVAELLKRQGFGPSPMTVLAHMGGSDEARLDCIAADWRPTTVVADFNTIAVDCRLAPGQRAPSRLPGLPDTAFEHDGQMTKQEVRAITLAALAPAPGQLLWDVGAGAGSVAIEWLRADRRNRAIAIECDAERRRRIAANASALGTPGLVIKDGRAPAALADLPAPDAIFVGGGLTAPGMLEACWPRLAAAGRLVANAVTVDGESVLYRWHDEIGGDMKRVSVSRAEPVGERLGWRPMMSVTQLVAVKS